MNKTEVEENGYRNIFNVHV